MESPNYSKAQRQAVEYGNGPLMVLAGPGSGKTFVITHRIRYLIEHLHIAPTNILVVTFSRAAAMEMKERFLKLGIYSEMPSFGTFHSIFFDILKKAYGYTGNQVLKEDERYRIMKDILFGRNLNLEDVNEMSSVLLSEISVIKSERIDIRYYYSKHISAEVFRDIYREYEEKISQIGKIDFEDMLYMTYDLLQQREDIRKILENKYRYILVDEFQDINVLQYEIIKMIAGERANLTIVGDDDQSIYRFRGAKPEIMLGFTKDFPDTRTILLDINFRSTNQILQSALALIEKNKKRFPKQITAFRGDGKEIYYENYPAAYDEIQHILSWIRIYQQQGISLSDMAILYRTNMQPRLLTEILLRNAIPFVLKDNIPNLYEHFIAKDLISYLKLAFGIGNRGDLLRIANKPNRYIQREALQSISSLDDLMEYYKDKPYMIRNLKELEHNLKTIAKMSLSTALAFIRKGIGYDSYLEEYLDYHGIEENDFFDILEELSDSAADFKTAIDWLCHIEDYKEDLKEKKKQMDHMDDMEGLRLMTFHASKGLEYKIVFILSANEGITPYKKAKTADDLEEERRMFYVAMTRAKDILHISSFQSKSGAEVSTFVKEIGKGKKNERRY